MKKEKEICVSFAVVPPTAKVMATGCDKCLVKMEKAFTFFSNYTFFIKARFQIK